MKITVKTGGLLGKHLPPGSKRNLGEVTVPENATPADVIGRLGIPPGPNYLVAINGEVVPQSERGNRTLNAGDQLSVMPPLKGG